MRERDLRETRVFDVRRFTLDWRFDVLFVLVWQAVCCCERFDRADLEPLDCTVFEPFDFACFDRAFFERAFFELFDSVCFVCALFDRTVFEPCECVCFLFDFFARAFFELFDCVCFVFALFDRAEFEPFVLACFATFLPVDDLRHLPLFG